MREDGHELLGEREEGRGKRGEGRGEREDKRWESLQVACGCEGDNLRLRADSEIGCDRADVLSKNVPTRQGPAEE